MHGELPHRAKKISFFRRSLISLLFVGIAVLSIAAPSSAIKTAQASAGNTALEIGKGILMNSNPVTAVYYWFGPGSDGNPVKDYIERMVVGLVNLLQSVVMAFNGLLAKWTFTTIQVGIDMLNFAAVKEGFKICLSIVNLLFVVGMIISAFEMIIGIHEGEAKKRLGKTILFALLINFSMLVAGFLLDISNVLTVFFSQTLTSDTIRNTLNPALFGLGATQPSVIMAVAALAFSIFVAIIMIAVFGTAIIRNIYVAVLLLVMPLSWGLLVFPGLEEYGKKWWNEFIKWGVVVLPTMTFFIYLATLTFAKTYIPSATMTEKVLNIIVVAGLMVAGLKIGQSAGGFAAKAVVGAVGAGLAGAATYSGAKFAYGKFGKSRVQGWSSKASEGVTNLAARGGALGLLGKGLVYSGAAGAMAKYGHRSHDLEEQAKARYGEFGKAQLINMAKSTTDKDELAKIFMILKGKKDGFKDLAIKSDGSIDTAGSQALKLMAGAYHDTTHDDAKDVSEVKEALAANPLLAPQIVAPKKITDPATGVIRNQTSAEIIGEWTAKISPSKMGDVSTDAFKDQNFGPVVLQTIASSSSQLRGLANNASEATVNSFKAQLFKNIEQLLGGAPKTNAAGENLAKLSENLRDINKRIADVKSSGLTGAALDAALQPLANTRQQIITDRSTILSGAGANGAAVKTLANGAEVLNQVIDGRTTI